MLTVSQLAELDHGFPVLRTLPATLREMIAHRGRALRFAAGQALFEDGSPCTAIVFLTAGRARVSKVAADGRELLLYEIRAGEFCILTVNCLLGRTAYPAQGSATEGGSGVLVPGELFEQIIAEVSDFRAAVFALLGTRLAEVLALVEHVAFSRLDSRLVELLLRASEPAGVVSHTHHQLAADLGCSREMVSRLLLVLQRAGVVRLGRRRIEIVDRSALERYRG